MQNISILKNNFNNQYNPKRGWQASRLPYINLSDHFVFITCTCLNGIILSEIDKDIVYNSIIYHDNNLYKLHAVVVMDTHFSYNY